MTAPTHFELPIELGLLHGVRAGSGQPLVLLHGNGQSWHEFEFVLPTLSKAFDVIALDLPGHGDSIATHTRLSVDAFADAIGQGLRELEIGPATVAGNSIGGFIAAALAARHSELVARAAIIEAQLRTPAWWASAWPMVEQLFAVPTQARDQVQARRISAVSDVEFARWNIDRNKAGTWAMLNVMRAIREHDLAQTLANVKCAAMLMFGAKGPAVETADASCAAIPHATRMMVSDAGHFIVADRPDIFVRDILEFAT